MKKGEIIKTGEWHFAVRKGSLNAGQLNERCPGKFKIIEIATNGVFIYALGECMTK